MTASAPTSVSARVEFRDWTYPLVARGDSFWGVFGIPLDAEAGEEPLRVTFHDADGTEIGDATGTVEIIEVDLLPIDPISLDGEAALLLTEETQQREDALRLVQFAQSDPEPAWTGPFLVPVSDVRVTTPFGSPRSYNERPVTSYHSGIDYAGAVGDPVMAAAPGRVTWTGEMPLRGHSVIIDHGAGVMTGYHHLSTIDVVDGDVVAAGDRIGGLGSTGLSTGPHLHWEVVVHRVNVDPSWWTFNSFLTGGSFTAPASTTPEQE
ncbi:MAG: M23 family metallopeptidase [Chloroflexi bacterium]|nr:M23 family metallopeptidase [Chloroflexota bacterium]